ncbi:MAG: type II toxin-antitoxin system RelE/ParE family toxin [Armatimonadetes bacterium]|nr:type II toxin-antitoxin system RelE/ParE family toxin [Armatimonadota bacterium]
MHRPRIEVHPDVYHEMEASRLWYEERARGLGTAFLDQVSSAVETVRASPGVWPWYDKKRRLRRFLIHRFPFALIYRASSTRIQVFSLMHQHRHPDYWRQRLGFFNAGSGTSSDV